MSKATQTALLHEAAELGNVSAVRSLLESDRHLVNCTDSGGWTALHHACKHGHLSMVRMLITEFQADTNAKALNGNTPLILAAVTGGKNVVLTLIQKFSCDLTLKGQFGRSLLHYACKSGNVDLVRTLILDYQANTHARDDENNLPIHLAAFMGMKDVVLTLIKEFSCDPTVKGQIGRSLLHEACMSGNVDLVRTLILDYQANTHARDDENNLSIHLAAFKGMKDVVLTLIKEFSCNPTVKGRSGRSLLHYACLSGNMDLVRTLVLVYKANTHARDDDNNLPIHLAALNGMKDMVLTLIKEFSCDPTVKGQSGRSLLHYACLSGNMDLVRTLILDCKADIYARDDYGAHLPIHIAAFYQKKDVVLTLIKEFSCDPTVKCGFGKSLLHHACESGNVDLVRTLVFDHNADIYACDSYSILPIHIAALTGKKDVVLTMINEFSCDPTLKDKRGRSLLHFACGSGNVDLVRTLILDYHADIHACDDFYQLPVYVAANCSQYKLVIVFIEEFNFADPSIRDELLGRSLLHFACIYGTAVTIEKIGHAISPHVADYDGNTPLHACASLDRTECVEAMLKLNAPVFIKNKRGQSPIEVACGNTKGILEEYVRMNQKQVNIDYKAIQDCAKKKYSRAQRLTRIFVIGNSGAGKSSLIESLKREGIFGYFWKVSESSVPPHTAGIVPSSHTSKHYGRVLFYDFAGDPEYYSSHATIFENIAKSRRGDNIFVLVVKMTERANATRTILHYWHSFIHHHLNVMKSHLIIVGSHFDKVKLKRLDVYKQLFCDYQSQLNLNIKYFMMDCCQPKSTELKLLQNHIVHLTRNSPHYNLSFHAGTLLGILEKDFQQVAATNVETILSHIEVTGIALPKDITGLFPILYELHEIGFLLLLKDLAGGNSLQVILNISELTNEVHKLLFSQKATQTLKKYADKANSSLNIGILSKKVLAKILPKHITKECLISLQYCQEISKRDINIFPAVTSCSDENFLFFPALCSVEKINTPLIAHPADFSYSMGWLAYCTDPWDYFSPRYLHVLLLRLVFHFTLTIPVQGQTQSTTSDLHLKRRCVMWKTGVHWLMEEGVECLVELVSEHSVIKGVVVSVRCKKDAGVMENCISVFNRIISCVMQAKAEFCHSIKPSFFLIDSPEPSNFLNKDHLFAMTDVERVLTSTVRKEIVVSLSGRNQMELAKISCLLNLSYWNTLFLMNFSLIFNYLHEVICNLHLFGIFLDIPKYQLEIIEQNFPQDIVRQKKELVNVWMNSSKHKQPPSWWHLVQALERIQHAALAEEIREKHKKLIFLQERLLSPDYEGSKPDSQFLEQFADLKEVKWEPLSSLLSLTSSEMEEVRRGLLTEQNPVLLTLRVWASRDGATYGQLCQLLKTVSLFHY